MVKQDIVNYFTYRSKNGEKISMTDVRFIQNYIKYKKGVTVTDQEIAMSINKIYKTRPFDANKYIQERLKYMIQALFKEFTVTILENGNQIIKVY